jgi:tetratricopeptide (TPR) repeat protein
MTSNHLLLYRIAELMLSSGRHVLAVDELFDDEKIGDFVKSIQIDSSYQQMLYEGVLTETVKDEQLTVSFTIEGYFHFILGEVIYEQSEGKDADFLINLLNNSKLKGIKEGIEQCLIRDIIGNKLERLFSFIDSGGDYLEICIHPLLYFMKSYGVDTTLNKLLENPTDNDWQALIKLNDLLDELQLQVLRKEFLNSIIKKVSFTNKYDTQLGLKAIEHIDDKEARIHYSRLESNAGFIKNDSELLSASGKCYERFGEYNMALENYEKSLDIELMTLGNEHPSVATSYNNIGEILYHQGKHENALEYFNKCLQIKYRTLANEHPSLATSYDNIGLVWSSTKLHYDKALEFYEKGLAIRLKTLGSEHPEVAISYNNISTILHYQGEYDKALKYFEKCLVIKLNILGGEHLSVAISYNNIGLVWNAKGDNYKALEYYEKSLAIKLKNLGDNHPSVAISYRNIGSIYDDQGEYEKSLSYYEKCLEIELKTLGEVHSTIAISYSKIGLVWKNKGEYDKALEYHEKSLAIRLKILGNEHPTVATSYYNIGIVWKNKGEYDKALEYFQKCLGIELKTLGGEHPSVAISYNHIGLALSNQGEYEKAMEFHQKCLDIRMKKFGIEDSRTRKTIANVKEMYQKLGKEIEMPDWMKNI